jgi:hypothetical protein
MLSVVTVLAVTVCMHRGGRGRGGSSAASSSSRNRRRSRHDSDESSEEEVHTILHTLHSDAYVSTLVHAVCLPLNVCLI